LILKKHRFSRPALPEPVFPTAGKADLISMNLRASACNKHRLISQGRTLSQAIFKNFIFDGFQPGPWLGPFPP
jgi:hypothetical protein